MEYVFNPIYNKTPAGPCAAGSDVTYVIKVSRWANVSSVFFVMVNDNDNTVQKIRMPLYSCDTAYFTYKATINFKKAGLFWYYFEAKNGNTNIFLCKTQLFDIEPMGKPNTSFAQIVYDKPSVVSKNYRSGIIYHIFVDRFKRTNTTKTKEGMILRDDWGGEITKNSKDFLVINQECFGGNLQGIIDKLPYIKSLGTTTIFLSPIFESFSYHKYDTADYEQVDSMFGGEAALKNLITEAKKLGIGILLDGVFNHSGSDSIYFNKLGRYNSIGAYQSKKSKYFDWFKFDKFPDNYSSWWGITTLPQFDAGEATLQQFIAGPNGVIAKYMKMGLLGFRLDVVDEVADVMLDKICARVKQVKPDAAILGEVWEDAATKIAYSKRRHYFSGNQLDGVMNYPLRNSIIDFVLHGNAEGLASTFFMLKDHYPIEVQNNVMNFLGTHDTKRILTVLTENRPNQALNLLKLSSAIQYCAPGVPAVFYGDEAGIQGGDAPFCRVCFPWGNENKEINNWYKKLGKLRGMDLLAQGDCNVLFAHNGVFVFERLQETKRIVVGANCSLEDFKLNLKTPYTNFETGKKVKDFVLLKPQEFVILLT